MRDQRRAAAAPQPNCHTVALRPSRIALVRSIVRSTRAGTPAREAAVVEAAGQIVAAGHHAGDHRVRETALRGWIARFEAEGEAGLIRMWAAGGGAHVVRLSREWDDAMHAADISDAAIGEIAAAVRCVIRAAWHLGDGGWRRVQRVVSPIVAALSQAGGLPLSGHALELICKLPRQAIERDAPSGRASRGSGATLPVGRGFPKGAPPSHYIPAEPG